MRVYLSSVCLLIYLSARTSQEEPRSLNFTKFCDVDRDRARLALIRYIRPARRCAWQYLDIYCVFITVIFLPVQTPCINIFPLELQF